MDNKLWYVVNTYSGYENKVKENLTKRIETMGMQDIIYRVIVPEEKEVEVKNGKKKEKTSKVFPGYVLIEMVVTDESWYVVRNTPGVTGFLGSSGGGAKPVPLQDGEIEPILKKLGMARVELDIDVEVGSEVKIKEGPFAGQVGTIESIDPIKTTMTVLVDLFGRETPVELEFDQVDEVVI
ncbi:transcription termination/antitermination protein NusG [Haloplasma contractile]|uniref:Transcription termination/antitermination protein NusG n=1 Tax=Haloplasma contractile SSD-17B TaxID=1033810 RepID=U2EC95_9MOLU|nr:transcription termination/antitermination protein NusG [Haloplasma contractile]ERJ12401.1 Transcription antitermination protein NusG [Haloplasma contractile SSD-17B]